MDESIESDWTNGKGQLVLTVGNCFKTLMMSSGSSRAQNHSPALRFISRFGFLGGRICSLSLKQSIPPLILFDIGA